MSIPGGVMADLSGIGFVSGDSHVNEPRNLWRENLPAKFREQALRGIQAGDDGNWEVILEGHQLDKTTAYEAERMLVADPAHRYRVMRRGGDRRRVHLPDDRPVRVDADRSRRRGGVMPGLQRVDRRRLGPLTAIQVRRAGAELAPRGRRGGGRADRRGWAGVDHGARGGHPGLEPSGLGADVVGDRGVGPAGGGSPGHRAQHVLLPWSRCRGGQPAGHPVDGAADGRAAGHLGGAGRQSGPARGLRRVQRRLAGLGHEHTRLLPAGVHRGRLHPAGQEVGQCRAARAAELLPAPPGPLDLPGRPGRVAQHRDDRSARVALGVGLSPPRGNLPALAGDGGACWPSRSSRPTRCRVFRDNAAELFHFDPAVLAEPLPG